MRSGKRCAARFRRSPIATRPIRPGPGTPPVADKSCISFPPSASTAAARSLSHPTRVYPSWAYQIVEVGYIRLRLGEGWGEGLWSIVGPDPSPRLLRNPTSPHGRGGAEHSAPPFDAIA